MLWEQVRAGSTPVYSTYEKRNTPILEYYDFVFRNNIRIFVSSVGGLEFVVICKSLLSSAIELFTVNEEVPGLNPGGDAKWRVS